MPREQRLRLWHALGRYDAGLEVLELGGSASDTVDDDELRVVMQVVLPARLDSVRVLFLWGMYNLTDASFQALAARGCGENLVSLWLEGSCGAVAFLFFLLPVFRLRAEHAATQGLGWV